MAVTADDRPPNSRHCPSCGGAALRRQRRLPSDHGSDVPAQFRRYGCRAAGCGWQGLLPRSGAARARALGSKRAWATVVPWLLTTLLVSALGAAILFKLLGGAAPDAGLPTHLVRAGESFDGNFLPAPHPLLKRVSEKPAVEAPPAPPSAAAQAPPRQPRAPAALHLRRHCAWGEPGRNPYRGTPEQALTLAQLPPEVVQRISADIQAQQVTDRVTITNATIRADATGREFNPATVAMTYGQTLCVDTRVNFKRDHAERADLYEATAVDGRVYAVMVPAVCGNVSVLGQRGERFRPVVGAEQAALEPMRRLPDALIFADDEPRLEKLGQRNSLSVPEPGSFWLVLPALALLAWLRSRRSAR